MSFGFGVLGSWFWVVGFGFWVVGFGFWIVGVGFWFRFMVYGLWVSGAGMHLHPNYCKRQLETSNVFLAYELPREHNLLEHLKF